MNEMTPIRLAEYRLDDLTAREVLTNLDRYNFVHGLQGTRMAEEIERYGPQAAVGLIPPIRIVHKHILTALLNGEVHTIDDLGKLSDEDIRMLLGISKSQPVSKASQILQAMRNLAAAQLFEQNPPKA